MIRYNLICENDHTFEAWFSGSKDYDNQAAAGFVMCPHCQSTSVEKAIMAPNIATSRQKEASVAKQTAAMKMMNEAADKIRREIETNCDYVGDKFADEARAIHYGEKPERGIYGEATPKEASELAEEGVGVAPLPDVLVPKRDKNLN